MRKKFGKVVFLLYLIFGVYFVNFALELIALPEFILNLNKWIIGIGGFLILIGGINYLRVSRRVY